jgi:signal transduction histidine kinase
MTDVSIWVAVISAGAAVVGGSIPTVAVAARLSRQQRREASDEIQGVARTVLDSQRVQETEGSRQADVMMRAAIEFSESTDRLAAISDAFISRLVAILERTGDVANASASRSFDSGEGSSGRSDVDGAQVIRELAHSLGTPLAQIKAESLRLAAICVGQEEGFETIAASVDLCNSFIGSFREIARIGSSGSVLSFVSLRKAVKTMTDVYMSGNKKSVLLQIDVPDVIDGYSNTYLLSILAPLVENAIEASSEGDLIEISCLSQRESTVFTVTNRFTDEPPSTESFASGVSTKSGHEGMGLAMVKRLVESRRKGSVDCVIDGDRATFLIYLPARHK